LGVAEAELLVGDPHDAGGSRLKHLDRYASSKSELFESVNLINLTKKVLDLGTLAS